MATDTQNSADLKSARKLAWRRADRAKYPEKYAAYARKYYVANSAAVRKRTQAYAEAHPGWQKEKSLKRNYGIDLARYNEMAEGQGGKCLICTRELPLVVDHCHSTGVVRGLLCRQCNAALGLFREDRKSLSRAIKYLSTALGAIHERHE